jgi:hypothetical protein
MYNNSTHLIGLARVCNVAAMNQDVASWHCYATVQTMRIRNAHATNLPWPRPTSSSNRSRYRIETLAFLEEKSKDFLQ